jgi:hypothetical protein
VSSAYHRTPCASADGKDEAYLVGLSCHRCWRGGPARRGFIDLSIN